MSSKIKVLLWDIDGTVLNFDASERAALRKGFHLFQLGECPDELIAEYSEINKKYWQRLERGEITKERVLEGRFEEFFAKKGLDVTLAKEFNRKYQHNLSEVICFEEGVKDLIWGYRGIYKQYAASNGTAEAQRNKLKNSGLQDVLDGVFISDEIGVEKPMKGFFDAVFAGIGDGINKDEILIIGDSMTSDIRGGIQAGIHTCWYNPKGIVNTYDWTAEYEIRSFCELPNIL